MFAQIDHAGAAREVGMELPNEVVVLFGNPRGGTPLMQQDPRIGIELPLRILVWDHGDDTNVGFKDLRSLSDVYDVPGQAATLEAMSSLLDQLANEAAQSSATCSASIATTAPTARSRRSNPEAICSS